MSIYPSNFESKIGFEKVREFLQARCLSSLGKEQVEACQFTADKDTVERQLDETIEFVKIVGDGMSFPNGYFIDMRPVLQRAKVEGSFMDVIEVFDLRRSLETIRAIVAFFRNTEPESFPRLKEVVKNVQVFPFIYERIDQILNKHGQIKDNASPELAQIRKDIFSLQSSVSKIMSAILRKMQAEGLVEKDIAVSMRDGRAVIPVGAANKRKIKGIIHDESATGKTSYVEPEEIVETNNRIRELESAERREIVKILTRFTDDVRPYADDIAYSYQVLAVLDFIRAKAIWSIESKANRPVITKELAIDWIAARHPLLEINLAREARKIVPLNIRLDKQDRILLISGPNAGGKSVCLKTVGLLQYMVQCGIPIPVQIDSRTGLFKSIFMDIGDDQSLDNDLSTYSSHLYNMKYFVKNCTPESLVLIDEFGTGTEPMLGGAIAESILNKINALGSFGVITTHYTNLKHFASSAPGIANGAMMYDSHRMEPLFQLQSGKPGSSFAFEIARKIGLPEDILQDATAKIGVDHIDFDKHLREIIRDKKYWESKRQKIRQEEKRLEELAVIYDTGMADTKRLRKEILDNAKREAEEILSGANKIIERTIRDIKEAEAEKEKTQEARQKFEAFKSEISKDQELQEDKILRKMEKLKQQKITRSEQQPKIEEKKKEVIVPKKAPAEIAVGGWVRLIGQETLGEVLEIKVNKITLAFGHLRSVVDRSKIESVSHSEVKKNKVENRTIGRINQEIGERKLVFKPSIDVRGKRAEEALQEIQAFVDEAIMVDANELRILHGKGNGVLRDMIQKYLRTEPAVKSVRDEQIQFGGSGITVVELG
jgi:DNA mismatch repair protein MutS2